MHPDMIDYRIAISLVRINYQILRLIAEILLQNRDRSISRDRQPLL